MANKAELPVLTFDSGNAFERWLEANHAASEGIWIKFAKKGSGIPSVTYAEAVEASLCWGWIDAQAKSIDDTWYVQHFTPRRPRSKWSAINVGKVEKLIAAGRMRPPGLAAVEAAKADGRWEAAYGSPATIAIPDDLKAALEAEPGAAEKFAKLKSSDRYGVLYRLHDAKRPETRAKRLATYVSLIARGETLFPPIASRKPKPEA